MFNKSRSPAPATRLPVDTAGPAIPLPELPLPPKGESSNGQPVTATPRVLSSLSSDLQFDGHISGSGDLQVDGAVKGDVRVARLIIGETGSIEGNVTADYIEIRGRIVGGLTGKQVKLIATAYVDGDITAEQLSIDIGAYFQGRVLQGRREAPEPVSPPKPVVASEPVMQFPSPDAPTA